MKNLSLILSLLLAVLASCTRPAPSVAAPEAPQHDTLAAFDTLMQSLPDSALYALLDFNDNHKNLTPFDRHYADLLLSEALFKNDYEQTLRPEVQQAQTYFDSLAAAHPKNDDFTLLSARSHYMNGVGFMEADSVVEACAEYLHTLQMMEDHFCDNELFNQKAKFISLTCNRLGDLFADQLMLEPVVFFYQKSLFFCKRSYTSSYDISRIFLNIGKQFDMMNNLDSAEYYYNQALINLPDTNNLYYRDILSCKALLKHSFYKETQTAICELKRIKDITDNEEEKLTRSMVIGSLHFHEKEYDSALLYLKQVFNHSNDYERRLQAASCLGEIFDSLGMEKESEGYMRFLAQQTMPEYENRILLSKLDDLFQQYLQWQHEKVLYNERKQSFKWFFLVSIIVVILTLIIIIVKRKAVKQNERNTKMMREKEKEHGLEMQEIKEKHQATQNAVSALSGRLKKSNEELRKQKEQTEILLKEKETWQKKENWNSINDFIEEDVCKEILGMMQGQNLKREAKATDNQNFKLNQTQLLRLKTATEKHFMGYGEILLEQCPKITKEEFNQCLLYLLDFDDKQVAALLGFDYSTIKKRSAKLKKAFGTEKDLPLFIKDSVL